MNESEFLRHFLPNASQIMWFLGAGTSRSAGMPTATDIIWDLKLRHYCLHERKDISTHDINNEAIKKRIQSYMDSKGFPPLWSANEYTFYFELSFGNDYAAQRKYLDEKLNKQFLSLNIGHRSLAGMLALGKTKIIFTTNFDEVIEEAYSKVSSQNISPYHLEGSYAALSALNEERFPIYAKIHGDFKYQSIKNLLADLISNDEKIQDCFIAACSRYGLVVTGYSGRDENVMSMFNKAVEQHNAFPMGLFWMVTSMKNIDPRVTELIEKANKNSIKSYIVETGTFDSLLSRIWKLLPDKTDDLNQKVRTGIATQVNIPLPACGQGYPIVRTNALPILELPSKCASIETKTTMTTSDVKQLLIKNRANTIMTKVESVVAWGDEADFNLALGSDQINSIAEFNFENPLDSIMKASSYHAFFERALVTGLINNRPLRIKNDKGFFIIVNDSKSTDPIFLPLKEALKDYNGNLGMISGRISTSPDVTWAEAVNVKLEIRNGVAYMILRPTIWIEPHIERRNQIDFIKRRKSKRYNKTTNMLLDAWIKILLGNVGVGEAIVNIYYETKYPAIFRLSTRTAFSRK